MTNRGISSEEVSRLVDKALTHHAKRSEQGTLVPGFTTITVDEDVALRVLGATLHKGLYLINNDEAQDGLHIKVYALSFSKFGIQTHEELQRMVEQGEAEREVLENGTEKISLRTADLKITATVKALTVSKREQPITLDEIGVWMAYAELIEQGEEAKAEALVMSAYASPENPIEEDDEETPRSRKPSISEVTSRVLAVNGATKALRTREIGEQIADTWTDYETGRSVETRVYVTPPSIIVKGERRTLPPSWTEACNTIMSTLKAGVNGLSPRELCQFNSGTADNPGTAAVDRFMNILDNMSKTDVTGTIQRDVLQSVGIVLDEGKTQKVECHMLDYNMTWEEDESGNRSNERVWFTRLPFFSEMADERNQITSMSQRKFMLIMSGLRASEENVTLANYLIARVLEIRNNRKLSNCIRYDNLYNDLSGVASWDKGESPWDELTRNKRAKFMSKVRIIMDGLQSVSEIYRWYEYQNDGTGKAVRMTTTRKVPKKKIKVGKSEVTRDWYETERKKGFSTKSAVGVYVLPHKPKSKKALKS